MRKIWFTSFSSFPDTEKLEPWIWLSILNKHPLTVEFVWLDFDAALFFKLNEKNLYSYHQASTKFPYSFALFYPLQEEANAVAPA